MMKIVSKPSEQRGPTESIANELHKSSQPDKTTKLEVIRKGLSTWESIGTTDGRKSE